MLDQLMDLIDAAMPTVTTGMTASQIQAARVIESEALTKARAINRNAMRAVVKTAKSISMDQVACLTVSASERETVMGLASIPCYRIDAKTGNTVAAESYHDTFMASCPIGTWGMGLTSYFGVVTLCRKLPFTPFIVSAVNADCADDNTPDDIPTMGGDAIVSLADEAVTGWLFEDGTWLSDSEASNRITVLRTPGLTASVIVAVAKHTTAKPSAMVTAWKAETVKPRKGHRLAASASAWN